MPDQAVSDDDLIAHAREVLARNQRGEHTCPSGDLYPHQWLWDSGFTAIGLATYDAPRAAGELRALLRGQWSTGMIPHMIFAPGIKDVGSRRIWQSRRFPEAPEGIETSCITQPPVLAAAVARVAERLPEPDGTEFLREVFPRLVEHHRWLYRERDLESTGLVTLIHPWECGLDTTPPWMRRLRHMRAPWWMRVTMLLRLDQLARRFRRDTRFLPAEERSSDHDGLRMLALARHIKRYDFDLRRLPRDSSVLVEDVAFNAILVAANHTLEAIATTLGETIDADLTAAFRRADTALEQLWDDDLGQYLSRNAVTGKRIPIPTVATFLALWAGVPTARTERLVQLLQEPSFWPAHPVPSVAIDAPMFDEDRYWKGPTWVNTNWIVIEGLRGSRQPELAEELRRRTVELCRRSGFSEYFSAITGAGYGADDFSWTAALALDLVASAPADGPPSRDP